ncbi:U3 small nucleolar RNA-associated protein 5 [Hypsizygus marmoreus]|uniref:U3 small nucleolar RNA-associated protein 5 n=1 Tax=Hypsizygus marmoreus TaxID=39966 RepID=A0A369KDQ6_HYPMA|nr:U3 small nucleolar RNA-associated protein 5 [Hypsizygus marmoreus]
MTTSGKTKKRTKPPQGRPVSTSTISQPVVEDSSQLTTLSSFSPDGTHFAFLSLAVDKHRLRVYSTVTGQSVAEHIIDSARVSALAWSTFDPSDGMNASSTDTGASPSKKKRRKRDSLPSEEEGPSRSIEVVILGLSDGSIVFFSPKHGRILRTLSHPTSTAEILSVAMIENGDQAATLWTSGSDGAVRLWDAQKNDILASWKNDDRIPYSAMAMRPPHEKGQVDVLAAHHSIRLLSVSSDNLHFDTKMPTRLASFTGHASPIRQLQWDASQTPSTRFLSLADADRFLYIWEVPEGSSAEGKPVASIPLDSDARVFSLSTSQKSLGASKRQTLLTLSASGKVSLFPVPEEFASPASNNRTQHKLPTLLPRSNLAVSSKATSSVSRILNAAFSGDEGSIRVARIVGGIRPVFDIVQYLDASGEFIPEVVIEDVKALPVAETHLPSSTQRYAESPSLAVGSGVQLGQDEEMDDLALRNIDGELDVDLAELSLGQRLTALSGADAQPISSGSDDEAALKEPKSSKKKSQNEMAVVPANSLTRTLIQALHSSDSRLLETCLAHSDQALIRNTVRRLPPQLAVPLITACVERLGRGARAGNMKGGGGGASSQRGAGLITWVKTTLAVHSGHLMTIPDLVARLSGLHATLTSRLLLQESLLSLSGRLDMVLSQIELRSSIAPAPMAPRKGKEPSQQKSEVKRYVEGESGGESDEDDEQMDVVIESGDEDGSVEDVELGGDSDEEGESEGDEEEEDDDSEGPTMNGFIDDEAEEYSEEDDESD